MLQSLIGILPMNESLRKLWWHLYRLFDGLLAVFDKGWKWALHLANRKNHQPQKSLFRYLHPEVEPLEIRWLPSTTTWTAGAGSDHSWTNSANWSAGVPGTGDTAVINNSGYTVDLDTNATITNLTLSAGTLTTSASKTLQVSGSSSRWTGGPT